MVKFTKMFKAGERPTDLNPSYSYHKGDPKKNERVKFKHWDDLKFKKAQDEKDTTYSSLWLYRTAKLREPFKDEIGSPSLSQAKKNGKEYFSEFNPLICENIINFWSDEGDTILDPFAGRTRPIVAGLKNRHYIGYEISPKVFESVNAQINKYPSEFKQGFKPLLYNKDVNGLQLDNLPLIDMILTCPPYFNLEKYESVPGQLSDIQDYNAFLIQLQTIMKKTITYLKENGFICLVVGDFRQKDQLIPFDCDTTKLMQELGVVLWDKIVLQNINFGWASFKFGSAKHKRQTSKVTEYLLVFKNSKRKNDSK